MTHATYKAAVRDLPYRTRIRWWLDSRDLYLLWRVGNVTLCLVTGHVEVENVNVRSKWDTHCAWCQKGMKPRGRQP